MNQNDMIKMLRLKNKEAEPSTAFIDNLKQDLMKTKETKSNTLLGLLTFGVLGIAVLVFALMTRENRTVPQNLQANPTVVASTTATPSEAAPVQVKTTQQKVYVTSAKRSMIFTYPEEYKLSFSYQQYTKEGYDDDAVRVKKDGKEIATFGVNWMGFDGTIPMKELTKMSTKAFGDVYRYKFRINEEGWDSWSYVMAKAVTLTGTCKEFTVTGKIAAPCAEGGLKDSLTSSKAPYMYTLVNCKPGNQLICDTLVSDMDIE